MVGRAVHFNVSGESFCGKGKRVGYWPAVTCGRCRRSDPNRRRICQRGHTNRFNKRNQCAECVRLWCKENRWKYAARQSETQKKFYRENRELVLARNRRWREKNRERERAVNRLQWYKSKPNPTEADIQLMIRIREMYPYRQPATV